MKDRAFVPLFERARHNRHVVEGLSGLVLPRPARRRAKNVPAFAGYRNQSRVAAMSDIAAVLAAGLMPIRQERHIVHIDHKEVRRPAAPLPDPAQAIRKDPLLQHIQVLFAAQPIHKAR